MARIPLIKTREGLSEAQRTVFDWIVESRGEMLRPYEVLLHLPEMARHAAELGHQIRYQGSLSDHDRELAIITTAQAHGCGFEWASHVDKARSAGVSPRTIAALQNGEDVLSCVDSGQFGAGQLGSVQADSSQADSGQLGPGAAGSSDRRSGEDSQEVSVDATDSVIVGFVQELCRNSTVSEVTWRSAQQRLGLCGVVELSTLVGYYTLLAFVMNASAAG